MYLFVDTETTGLDAKQNAIVQVAALWVLKSGHIGDQFNMRVKPFDGALIEGRALSVNKRSYKDLHEAPTEKEVCLALQQWNRNRVGIFAGYNCKFDQRFVWSMMQRTGIFTKYSIPDKGPLDVLEDVKEVLRKPYDVPDHKLTTAAKYFGVQRDGAHDALEDILMTVDVWRKAMKRKESIKLGKI